MDSSVGIKGINVCNSRKYANMTHIEFRTTNFNRPIMGQGLQKGWVVVKALVVELKILLCDSKLANNLQDEIHNTCILQC